MYVVKRAKIYELSNETFISDFQVRWNTTYDMLERFFEFKILIDEITYNPILIEGLKNKSKDELRNLALNLDDWRIVETLIKVLKPFKRVTDMLQGQKYETLALSKVAELIIFQYYDSFSSSNNKEYYVVEKIKEYLDKYLVEKISKEQHKTSLVNVKN